MLNNEVAQQDVKDESKNKNDYKPETVAVQNKPKNRKGWKRFWRKGNSTAENAVAQQNVNDESGNRVLCLQPNVENNPKVENKLKRHEPKRRGYVGYCGDDDGDKGLIRATEKGSRAEEEEEEESVQNIMTVLLAFTSLNDPMVFIACFTRTFCRNELELVCRNFGNTNKRRPDDG